MGEIKDRLDAIRDEIRKHQREIEKLRIDMRYVKLDCDHKEKYETSHMGERCVHCTECGCL